MKYYIVSIFPEIFDSFISTSLISKSQKKSQISFFFYNPRSVCSDKHQKVDDIIYWWWPWLLMKAEPIIKIVEKIIKKHRLSDKKFKIIFVNPSKKIFNQKIAKSYAESLDHIILICARYEWIDYRINQYFSQNYKNNFVILSIWKYITLGWEVPAMIIIEAISRLIKWVIQKEDSRKYESYSENLGSNKIEYPQYTRPEEVFWFRVPEVLVSWHHKNIEERKKQNLK